MSKTSKNNRFSLTPVDHRRLANLRGHCDEHLRQLEKHLNIEINNRENHFHVTGNAESVTTAQAILQDLYEATKTQEFLTPEQVHLSIQENISQDPSYRVKPMIAVALRTKHGSIKVRGNNQQLYLNNIFSHDINFGIGPAGTGKTYLAIASAVEALEKEQVNRILLVRPAVEAGEHLGFLPGDLEQKVDPYFRPLYDALHELLGFERVAKLMERHVIEIAPLAYMRGRTLNNSFIILDESQNTTREQMKMFLTRIGFGSIAVITGDLTQIDLPKGKQSGLHHALRVLKDVPGISFTRFEAKDVVRHPLVQAIVRAYDKHEDEQQDNA